MQVFKTAIKTVLRHPMYLIVYAGFLSMMGVFIASGLTFGGTNDSEFSPYETKFAVIDRDGSALSDGLAAYLREQGIEVPIEDSQMALQDAVFRRRTGREYHIRRFRGRVDDNDNGLVLLVRVFPDLVSYIEMLG